MKNHEEYEILDNHIDMFDTDLKNNILIAKENASREVIEAIRSLNKKMNK